MDAEWGYLWRLQWLGIGGRLVLHTLRSGYVPCLLAHWPPPPVRGGEAEKALIISIDCASSRPRDTAASGQHRPRGCPPIILKTHRRFQKSPFTHRPLITQTLIATAVPFLSEMAVDAALSSVSSNKAEKAACSSNGGRVGHKLEEEVHLGWEVDAEVEELQLGGVTTNQPALASPPANCCRLIMQ